MRAVLIGLVLLAGGCVEEQPPYDQFFLHGMDKMMEASIDQSGVLAITDEGMVVVLDCDGPYNSVHIGIGTAMSPVDAVGWYDVSINCPEHAELGNVVAKFRLNLDLSTERFSVEGEVGNGEETCDFSLEGDIFDGGGQLDSRDLCGATLPAELALPPILLRL